MAVFCGIDPGLTGAIAVYDLAELLIWDMPTFEVTVNGKTRNRLDVLALKKILIDAGIDHALIEKVNAQPANGVAAAFAYGYGVGVIDACVQCCGVSFTHVPPQTWKKKLQVPSDKDSARLRANQLMPEFAHNWPLKKHHGRAEAALLAYYAAMKITGK